MAGDEIREKGAFAGIRIADDEGQPAAQNPAMPQPIEPPWLKLVRAVANSLILRRRSAIAVDLDYLAVAGKGADREPFNRWT